MTEQNVRTLCDCCNEDLSRRQSHIVAVGPFDRLTNGTHEVIETLLGDIYREGEWEDRHDDMLDAWRAARGEEAKDHWLWWIAEPDAELYEEEFESEAEAIKVGRVRYAGFDEFKIIEARLWIDNVKEGSEECWFAESRGNRMVKVVAND